MRVEEFFVLDALEDGERVPGDVVMDAGYPAGPACQGEDGE
jgi:hypothetical protein